MNVTALVDASGTVVERYQYDPYGSVTILYDSETGLYHVRNRYYHPTLGRWTKRDPWGYFDSVSLYEYVVSCPMVYVDWLGRTYGISPSTKSGGKEGDSQGGGATKPGSSQTNREEQIETWKKRGEEGKKGLEGKGVADRARYVADAMIECAKNEGVKNKLKAVYGEKTSFAEGGYAPAGQAAGAVWVKKGASGKDGPGFATGDSWPQEGAELSLPPNYGEDNWSRPSRKSESHSENLALAKTGCFDEADFTKDAKGRHLVGFNPKGLMGLATTLAWESAHWGPKGTYSSGGPVIGGGGWMGVFAGIDCCCLRLLLGMPVVQGGK